MRIIGLQALLYSRHAQASALPLVFPLRHTNILLKHSVFNLRSGIKVWDLLAFFSAEPKVWDLLTVNNDRP